LGPNVVAGHKEGGMHTPARCYNYWVAAFNL